MSSFRIRPHFRTLVAQDADAAREQLVARLSGAECGCEVKSFPGYISLRFPEEDQHFWSPQLNLSLEAADEGGTAIQGIYGPGTNVWALFLYGYLFVTFLGIAGAVVGLSQWMIDTRPWGFWLLGAAALIAAILYFVAQTGQKLGAWQTFQLHQAFEKAIGESVKIS